MSRPLRIEYPGAWYYAMNRGAGYRKIFFDQEDCLLFLTALKEACNLFNDEVCKYFKISEDKLFSSRRGEENIQRHIAVSLARELSGLSFSAIAKRYKISSYRTVGSLCCRFREKLKKNKRLSKQYEEIKILCSQEWI